MIPHDATGVHQHIPAIRYVFDRERDLILEEWVGKITRDALSLHWREFVANPVVMDCRRTIVDLSRAEIDLNGEDLKALINSLVVPALNGRKWITAIIAGGLMQHGVSRQYGVYAEIYSTDQIFKTFEEALEWITPQMHETGESE